MSEYQYYEFVAIDEPLTRSGQLGDSPADVPAARSPGGAATGGNVRPGSRPSGGRRSVIAPLNALVRPI
jgi:hypothetical protein